MMQQANTGQARDEQSLGELFGDLARETGTLVSQEIALARTELTDKATRVGKHVAMLAAGGLVAYAGFLAILLGVIVLIANQGVPLWMSALLVGAIVAVVGYILVMRGVTALKNEDLTPRQTLDSLKDDTRWAKEQLS